MHKKYYANNVSMVTYNNVLIMVNDFLYEYINTIFLPSCGKAESERVWCSKVEVRETDSNMAMRVGHREDNEFSD